ncbi:MAG TPA: PHB depolymerase family esterase [Kofleriaceae bacterium]|nr:PHB depolymerase family esterase [Kofleriaceae bacterium]
MRGLVLGLFVIAACSSDSTPPGKIYGGDRPAELKTPATLTEGKQYPLLVVLHGFGASGFVQTAFFGVGGLPGEDKALLIAPDGTENSTGQQFWNADPACCDFEHHNPDDVAYIGGLIDDISADWPVDKKQVFILGHSNGGYMAYRMACERADVIAAIASLAGNASSTSANCNPSQKVNVVHLHGTADDTVPYSGATPSVDQWATKNGCGTTRSETTTYDFDSAVEGAETHVNPQADCPANGDVELWTMEGSTHIPVMNATFAPTIFDWFTAHKR